MTAREDLEAVIRRQLTNMTRRPHTANECTDAILKAADSYAAAVSRPAPRPGALVMTEADLGALVNAGQHYDHEYRPRGQNWGRVSDHQAARLILGAVARLRELEAGTAPARDGSAARDGAVSNETRRNL